MADGTWTCQGFARMRAQACLLSDGRRLHLHDGPIDLVLEAFGAPDAREGAREAATRRFATILDELCAELPALRSHAGRKPAGEVAGLMFAAVDPFSRSAFITPMAAVAGAVAQAVLRAIVDAAPVHRAYVNNGGDIALHLGPGTDFAVGLVDRPDRPSLFGRTLLAAAGPVRGVATSGWRGRSFSLGIADAVTVLADTASMADAAATMIANAVDLPGHPAVTRCPAASLQPDSDLADRLVTRAVGALCPSDRSQALEAGAVLAERIAAAGLIRAAALHLQGETRSVGDGAHARPALEPMAAHA